MRHAGGNVAAVSGAAEMWFAIYGESHLAAKNDMGGFGNVCVVGVFRIWPSARNKCGKNLPPATAMRAVVRPALVQPFVRVSRAKQLRPLICPQLAVRAKRARCLLQERRSFINGSRRSIRRRWSHRWMFHASHALVQSAFFHGEIRRNREEIGSGLLTLDVRQRINGVTKTGIAVFALHYICKSGEYQTSRVTVMGLSLPMFPAGIRRVNRVPCALIPLSVCVPSDSFVTLELVVSAESIASGPPDAASALIPLPALPFLGPWLGSAMTWATFLSGLSRKPLPATGS